MYIVSIVGRNFRLRNNYWQHLAQNTQQDSARENMKFMKVRKTLNTSVNTAEESIVVSTKWWYKIALGILWEGDGTSRLRAELRHHTLVNIAVKSTEALTRWLSRLAPNTLMGEVCTRHFDSNNKKSPCCTFIGREKIKF